MGPHSPQQLSRYVPPAPALVPAVAVEIPPARLPHEPVDATAILPWLVVLGFLGLLAMLLTSLA